MEMRRADNSVETVNAAATAIISAEDRVQQVIVPRRRWGACFSVYWCFGSQRQGKRISHAALVPEASVGSGHAPQPEIPNRPPPLTLPFIAPPSSPVSFLQSEPPSAIQSPTGFLSLSALAQNSYSPTTPTIFSVGPYANETQLVSPPVFSTFTTEPSTAPLTPPPEPVQLTTPSSPEVPFAKLLSSSFNKNCRDSEAYEFHSYHLYPGSPIGYLISPSSASGNSSPFPDPELRASPAGSVPMFGPSCGSRGRVLPDYGQAASVERLVFEANTGPQADDPDVVGHRVSFELTAEEVARCMEKKPAFSMPERDQFMVEGEGSKGRGEDGTHHDLPSFRQPSLKEFKFSNSDGTDAETAVGPDWWANEKVVGPDVAPQKKWAFFPMVQHGIS